MKALTKNPETEMDTTIIKANSQRGRPRNFPLVTIELTLDGQPAEPCTIMLSPVERPLVHEFVVYLRANKGKPQCSADGSTP